MKLARLFKELDRYEEAVPLDNLVELVKQLETTVDTVSKHIRFDDACYQRNLLHAGEGYQAWVLCWGPGQCSPIHDHRGSSCAVRVLQGTVTERTYTRDDAGNLAPGPETTLETGEVCGSHGDDIHEICNQGQEGLITLHIDAPPLLTMGVYRRDSDEVTQWTP